jgi:carbonic anhydrase/acetyltransferase-like protein (isoleucine patch superfamily)
MLPHPGAIIMPYRGIFPTIHPDAWIAPGAIVIGDVHIGAFSNVWFGCVIRGDVNSIRIGERTNIQDNSTVHVTRITGPTSIGSGITIGHKALIHACTLQDDCFIGMGATIMDFAMIEKGAFIAAGAQVTPKKTVKSGEMWMGAPAKFARPVTPEEAAFIPVSAGHYVTLSQEYKTSSA